MIQQLLQNNFTFKFTSTNELNTTELGSLICKCFNGPPWREKWTIESAKAYLDEMASAGADFIVVKSVSVPESVVALGIGRKLDGVTSKFDSELFNKHKSCYHIHAIMVSEDARSKGIAKLLVSMLIKKGEELGVEVITSRTRSNNYPMIGIFRSNSLDFYGAEELTNGKVKHISCIFGKQIKEAQTASLDTITFSDTTYLRKSLPEISLQQLRKAFCERDPVQLAEVLSLNASLYSPGTTVGTLNEVLGREAIVSFFRDIVFSRFLKVDFKLTGESLTTNGTTHLAVEWQSILTTDSGQDYSNHGAWFITTDPDSGKIVRLVEYFDTEKTKANLDKDSSFYDFTAPIYHEIYQGKWGEIVKSQGNCLDKFIRSNLQVTNCSKISVLDSACGVGTQVLGLSALGYSVIGIDISDRSIHQAVKYAGQLSLGAQFKIGNMLRLSEVASAGSIDCIINADNAIRHLANEEEIKTTLKEMLHCLNQGGIAIFTLRDLEHERRDILEKGANCSFRTYSAHVNLDGSAKAFFQLGRFNGPYYEFDFFAVDKTQAGTHARSMPLKLLAITSDRIIELMKECGFTKISKHNSINEFYGHDVLIATK